jgi:acyl carrier protein
MGSSRFGLIEFHWKERSTMSISSRTPEGVTLRCPLCHAEGPLEVSPRTGDAACPACGHLLWLHRDMVANWRALVVNQLRVKPEMVTLDARFIEDLGADSLAMVELVMELEEAADIQISDHDAVSVRTFGDLLRVLVQLRQPPETA